MFTHTRKATQRVFFGGKYGDLVTLDATQRKKMNFGVRGVRGETGDSFIFGLPETEDSRFNASFIFFFKFFLFQQKNQHF